MVRRSLCAERFSSVTKIGTLAFNGSTLKTLRFCNEDGSDPDATGLPNPNLETGYYTFVPASRLLKDDVKPNIDVVLDNDLHAKIHPETFGPFDNPYPVITPVSSTWTLAALTLLAVALSGTALATRKLRMHS